MKLRFKILGLGACLAMATAGLGFSTSAGAKTLGAVKGFHEPTYGTYVDFSGGTYPDGGWAIGQIFDGTNLTTDACLVLPLSTNGTSLTGNNIQGIDDPNQPNPNSKPGTWHIAYGTTAPYSGPGALDSESLTEGLAALPGGSSCVPNSTPSVVNVSWDATTVAGQITFTSASTSHVINGIADISNGQEQIVEPCAANNPKVDTFTYPTNGATSATAVTWGTEEVNTPSSGKCTYPFTTAGVKQPTIGKPLWDTGTGTSLVCGGAGAPRNVYDTEGVSNSSSNPAMTYNECSQDSTATDTIKGSAETAVVSGLTGTQEAYVQEVRTNVTTTAQYTQVGPEMGGTGTLASGHNGIPAGKCKAIATPATVLIGVPQHWYMQCDGWSVIPFTIVSRSGSTDDSGVPGGVSGDTDSFKLFNPQVDSVVCAKNGQTTIPADCPVTLTQ